MLVPLIEEPYLETFLGNYDSIPLHEIDLDSYRIDVAPLMRGSANYESMA